MYSIDFPVMFKSSKTLLLKDSDATLSNLKLLLNSTKNTLFGDPYYGTNLKKFIFEQNDIILQDIIIDEIYTSIITFMPQIYIERNYIKLLKNGVDVVATIKCVNKLDHKVDLYTINLTSDEN